MHEDRSWENDNSFPLLSLIRRRSTLNFGFAGAEIDRPISTTETRNGVCRRHHRPRRTVVGGDTFQATYALGAAP